MPILFEFGGETEHGLDVLIPSAQFVNGSMVEEESTASADSKDGRDLFEVSRWPR
jgi:hypothetical protein